MRILRGLSSACLPCGCLAGVYETYENTVVTILDAKGTGCPSSSHREGNVIPTIDKASVERPQSISGSAPID